MHRLFFKCPELKEQFRLCPLPPKYPNHDTFGRIHSKAMAELVDKVKLALVIEAQIFYGFKTF